MVGAGCVNKGPQHLKAKRRGDIVIGIMPGKEEAVEKKEQPQPHRLDNGQFNQYAGQGQEAGKENLGGNNLKKIKGGGLGGNGILLET